MKFHSQFQSIRKVSPITSSHQSENFFDLKHKEVDKRL